MIRPVRSPATLEIDALRVDPRRDPPRLLLVGPPGSGKSALCRARFSAALEAAGPGAALLLLPTYGEVEHEKRVAVSRRSPREAGGAAPRGGRPVNSGWGPRRVDGLFDEAYATFTSLGERAIPDWRVGRLPSRIERDLLAGEALRVADVEAFRRVRDKPGFRSRFLRLVKEMKQTGGDPAVLREEARERAATLSSPAARERLLGFLRAWEAYDGLLAAAGVPDHEDALRALLVRLRSDPPAALTRLACLAVDGFDDLSGLESALLLACVDAVTSPRGGGDRGGGPRGGGTGGRVAMTLPFDPARASLYAPSEALISRLRDAAGFTVHTLPACRRSRDPAVTALCHGLFAGGEGGPEEIPADGGVRAIVGCDPADEVDRIGREILRLVRGSPAGEPGAAASRPFAFRDVAVVFRRLDEVGPSARRALEALGVPARLVGAGAPLAGEAPVRALRGPLRLLAGDDGEEGRPFDAARLLDHARWTALASGAEPAVDPDDVDRLDVVHRSGGAPSSWRGLLEVCRRAAPGLSAWAARIEEARASCARAAGPRAAFEAVRAAVTALLPLPQPSGFSPEGRPLDPAGDARLARAGTAKAALLSLAEDLADAHERTRLSPALTAAEAAGLLLAAARDASCEPTDRRLDAVALLDAEEARHWEVGVVFVAGLVERSFPLHPREDVFLRDADRETLSASRKGRGDDVPAASRAAGPQALSAVERGAPPSRVRVADRA